MEIDPPTFHLPTDTSTPAGTETSITTLNTFPRKRPLNQADPFFQEGTYEYKAAWLRLEDANAYIPDLNEPEDNTHRTVAQACHYGSCHGERTFSSTAMYEHHFDTNHRYICQTCKKAFPGEKWLVLHIREIHDVLVRIQRERGEKTYQCYVDDCDRMCSTPQKRRMHLIDKHQYPKQFNFSIVVTGVIPSAQRTAFIQKQNYRETKKQGQQKTTPRPHKGEQQHHDINDHDMADENLMDIEPIATASTLGPKGVTVNRRNSATPEPASTKSFVAAPRTVKKNAFQQYRSPETKTKPSTRRPSIAHDDIGMDMDAPLTPSTSGSASVVSTGSSIQVDMDMDQLQLSMSRLMVPRSVAKKMAAKPRTTATATVAANSDNS